MKKCIVAIAAVTCWVMPTFLKKQRRLRKGIALTFDDGPHPIYTPALLDVLKNYKIRATFFVVGQKVERYPELVKRMHEEGHEIGIHHYRHVSSWILTPAALQEQVEKTAAIIECVTGKKPRYYRPPWGHMTIASNCIKYERVLWTRHFKDWKIAYAKQMEPLMHSSAQDGEIWLLHDCGTTIGADELAPRYMLESLTAFLASTTCEFVTLEQAYDR